MKISLNWLRELVALPPTVDELVRLLTMAGVEVEGVETRGVAIDKVVVARIAESTQHPNADRLSVCQVDDGSGLPRQIVCGAKNFKVGDCVPLALPGSVLPGDFKIKVGKLRGVESQGMLCSATELGLPKGEDGLFILPAESKPGMPLGELFPGDTILDLEITPNRADLLSMHGIAREVATLMGGHFQAPEQSEEKDEGELVTVADGELCPLYTARKIVGIKVGESPAWLRAKLEAVGSRSINSVVDITNFVMLETGQPLHAFDAAKLDGALNVRLAREGEEFLALDGKTYRLSGDQLVIADQSKAVAIAGVMGGQETGVTEATTEVWLESAVFQAQSIRRTSRTLGLSSDSSYRYERGVDANGVLRNGARALNLIREWCGGHQQALNMGGRIGEGTFGISGAHFYFYAPPVSLRSSRVRKVLGVEVPEERIEQILTGFGLRKEADQWVPPSFRPDLTREIDLIEEIARVIGMEAIPSKTQAQFAPASTVDALYDFAMETRRALVAQRLHEARNIALVPAEPLGLAALQIESVNLLRVKNPMIDDQVSLRPHLLHGLLMALRENLRAGALGVRLFEIGRVYAADAPETTHAAMVLTGGMQTPDWREQEGRELDIFDLKGALTAVFGAGLEFMPRENSALALALDIVFHGKLIGYAGQLWPVEARALDAKGPVIFAEIALADLHAAVGNRSKKYREIIRYPSTSRDVALLVPLQLAHGDIVSELVAANEVLLERVDLFDVFTDPSGSKIPADKKSLAYSLTYRALDRTLTAPEVEAVHARLKERLQGKLEVSFRE